MFILILLLTIAVLLGMVLASRPPAAAPTTVVITPSSAPTTSGPALPTETEFPTPSGTPTEQVAPSNVAPGGAAPGTSRPQWQGQVRVTGDGIDLDSIPPSKGGSVDVYYYASRNEFSFYYVVSPWTGTGDPTYQDCLDRTATQALSSGEASEVKFQEGASYCLRTTSDKLTSVRPAPPVSGDGIQVNVTVW